jgi:Arc/MetJ-type ribon-helix-helix transcriptional regulator
MITIRLTEDLERFVFDAVRDGHYARADEVVSDGLVRLRQSLQADAGDSGSSPEAPQPAKPLTKQEFQRHLVNIGLIDPPVGGSEADESDQQLMDDEEEVVSEFVIRERLIEWLTGFLTQ